MTLPILSAARRHSNIAAFENGAVRVTYGDLEAMLVRSRSMQAVELCTSMHVAWCPKNDLQSFLEFWSILYRGCVACPISHRFPKPTRDEVLQRIEAKWLADMKPGDSLASRLIEHDPLKPATIILSSGSTGLPKAVVHSLEAHVASAAGAAENMPLHPGDRWLWSLPLCHVSGLSILVRCAVAAATVVGMPSGFKLTAELLNDARVTHLSVVSTQLRELLHEKDFPSPHLQAVLLGGGSVDPAIVEKARNRGVPVYTTYGLTEMGSQVTTSTPSGDPAKSGCLLPGRQMKICSSGEIAVRGKVLCLGYFREGKVHSVVDQDGWFYTKDIGELDSEQQLYVKGRMDNMFISGGENIYPEAIERMMLRSLDVEQVVVVPKADARFGETPVAFVMGSLPSNWEDLLRKRLQAYEVPVEIYSWPAAVEGTIKPDRNQFRQLVHRK